MGSSVVRQVLSVVPGSRTILNVHPCLLLNSLVLLIIMIIVRIVKTIDHQYKKYVVLSLWVETFKDETQKYYLVSQKIRNLDLKKM